MTSYFLFLPLGTATFITLVVLLLLCRIYVGRWLALKQKTSSLNYYWMNWNKKWNNWQNWNSKSSTLRKCDNIYLNNNNRKVNNNVLVSAGCVCFDGTYHYKVLKYRHSVCIPDTSFQDGFIIVMLTMKNQKSRLFICPLETLQMQITVTGKINQHE